jgi:hypothetical protein
MSGKIPPLSAEQGRVYFYRSGMPVGMAVQPGIVLNGETVGNSQPGGFFFVDRAPGTYEASCATEAEHKLSFVLAPGEEKYVRTSITMGLFIGQVWPSLVGKDEALNDLKGLRYTGKALP